MNNRDDVSHFGAGFWQEQEAASDGTPPARHAERLYGGDDFPNRLLALQAAAGRLPSVLQYALATFFVVVALSARYVVGPGMDGPRFIFLLPAVLLSAALFSRVKWLYATLLSIVGMEFIFTEPTYSFGFDNLAEAIAAGLFVLIGLLVASLVEGLKSGASKLTVTNKSLRKAVEDLAKAESQKTLLLYEINHRIKNDLSSIASTLNLQARSQAQEETRDALQAASGRVNVLGRIYDRLHLREKSEAATVDTGAFIHQLCADIRAGLISSRPINLRVDAHNHELPIERAVPLGLIINELVTNALKYAFPRDRSGVISVRLRLREGLYCLEVSDDGVGMSSPRPGGLGQRMIGALVQQVGGRMEVIGTPGVTCVISFPV